MAEVVQNPRVLVVDDEPNIRELVQVALNFHGCVVTTGATGEDALSLAYAYEPDLIVLDVLLPDIDGFEVCRRLRSVANDVPVIFLTARDATADTVTGLTIGADDYITKPFSVEALVARVRAVLRRTAKHRGRGAEADGQGAQDDNQATLRVADLELDEDHWTVHRAGVQIELSPTEFRLLAYLMRNQGLMLTRKQLLDNVWGWGYAGQSQVLETYVSYLRRKLDPLGPPLIHTQRGVGYSLRSPALGPSGESPVLRAQRPLTRKLAAGRARLARRTLSLRARLLAGLIVLTTTFLVVMGVVTTVVLGTLEHNQLNAEVRLASRQSVIGMARGADGFAAAYLSLDSGTSGTLTDASPTAATLVAELRSLSHLPRSEVFAKLGKLAGYERPFDLTIGGTPTVRAAWRGVPSRATASAKKFMPTGPAVILVGRSVGDATSNVRGIVLTELITGSALIALLAVCGNWLIGRGLAPLRRMARTADLITRSGDLAARMPDAGGQQETARLAAAINTMLARIQHSFSARLRSEQKVRQFAADASHELRTPLTTIRGYAELYRANAFGPDELPNAMRRIEQEAERMSLLVAELLELARLDRPSSLDLSDTDLTVLVKDAVADARAVEPDRELTTILPSSLVVTADEPRIRQVLANLLGNVRAHTPPGTPAAVRLYTEGSGAVIEVSDQGPGMSEHDAAQAFDRFHRGESAALAAATAGRPAPGAQDGTKVASSGLGLSIVQAIATAHGGHADLTAHPGHGTTVRLWIPRKNQDSDSERVPASPDPLARA